MTQPPAELVNAEKNRFARSPDWELNNIKKALSMLELMNTPEEAARLVAVRQILRERKRRNR